MGDRKFLTHEEIKSLPTAELIEKMKELMAELDARATKLADEDRRRQETKRANRA
jgi:hypothetical protein